MSDEGIHQRRFGIWRFWPWQAFNQGRGAQESNEPYQFTFPDMPFWKRCLTISADNEHQQNVLWEQCWNRMDLDLLKNSEDVPRQIILRDDYSRKVIMDSDGVVLKSWGSRHFYRWDQIGLIAFKSSNTPHAPLAELLIRFPNKTLRFYKLSGWPQGERRKITRFLKKETIRPHVIALPIRGPLDSIEEVQIREEYLKLARNRLRLWIWIMWAFLCLYIGHVSGKMSPFDAYSLAITLIIAPFFVGYFAYMPYLISKEHKEERDFLQKEKFRLQVEMQDKALHAFSKE